MLSIKQVLVAFLIFPMLLKQDQGITMPTQTLLLVYNVLNSHHCWSLLISYDTKLFHVKASRAVCNVACVAKILDAGLFRFIGGTLMVKVYIAQTIVNAYRDLQKTCISA